MYFLGIVGWNSNEPVTDDSVDEYILNMHICTYHMCTQRELSLE